MVAKTAGTVFKWSWISVKALGPDYKELWDCTLRFPVGPIDMLVSGYQHRLFSAYHAGDIQAMNTWSPVVHLNLQYVQ